MCFLPSLPEPISHYSGVLGHNFPSAGLLLRGSMSAQIELSFLASLVAGTPGTGFSAKAAGFPLV